MSTRACVALKIKDNNAIIIASMVDNDGYLSHLGKILITHYNTYDKVYDLINLGDASSIHESIEKSKDSEETKYKYSKPSWRVALPRADYIIGSAYIKNNVRKI